MIKKRRNLKKNEYGASRNRTAKHLLTWSPKADALAHSTTQLWYMKQPNIRLLTHTDRRRNRNISNAVTFELSRVEGCHWNWVSLLVFTLTFQWKNLRFLCDFGHTNGFKKICRDFYIVKKMDFMIFCNLGRSQRPLTTFFTNIGKSF